VSAEPQQVVHPSPGGLLIGKQVIEALRKHKPNLSDDAIYQRKRRAFATAAQKGKLGQVGGEPAIDPTQLGLPAQIAATSERTGAAPPSRMDRLWRMTARQRKYSLAHDSARSHFPAYAAGCKPGTKLRDIKAAWVRQFGARFGIKTVAALDYHRRRWRTEDDSACDDGRGRPRNDFVPDEEAAAYFKSLYLQTNQPDVSFCFEATAIKAKRRNWRWFTTYNACWLWAKRTITRPERVLNREGEKAYRQKCAPVLEQDVRQFAGGECYVGDHHQFPVWVWDGDELIRPWITAWLDFRSHAIVGWHLCRKPNQSTILLALRHACLSADFGVPHRVLVDNGKDYTGYAMAGWKGKCKRFIRAGELDADTVRGLLSALEIELHLALPYNPNSKPIEAWFGQLHKQFCKALPSYAGRDPNTKPEDLAKRLAKSDCVPTLEAFAADVDRWINAYNRAAQSDARALDLLMMIWPRSVKVSNRGVTVRIASEDYSYGQFALAGRQGEKVRVSYDPRDLDSVQVWTLDLRHIASAPLNHQYGRHLTEELAREASREKSRLRKAARYLRDNADLSYQRGADLAVAVMQRRAVRAQQAERRRATGTDGKAAATLQPLRTQLDGQAKRVAAMTRPPALPPPDPTDDVFARLAAANDRLDREEQKKPKEASGDDLLLAWARREKRKNRATRRPRCSLEDLDRVFNGDETLPPVPRLKCSLEELADDGVPVMEDVRDRVLARSEQEGWE
jgi:hypothetical protein